jgi:hypothetical protein
MKGKHIMSIVARICLGVLALGILIGLFTEGIVGGIVGFFLAGTIAVPLYCLTNVFKRDAAAVNMWEDPLSDVPSSSRNDPSQLPKAAYWPSKGR